MTYRDRVHRNMGQYCVRFSTTSVTDSQSDFSEGWWGGWTDEGMDFRETQMYPRPQFQFHKELEPLDTKVPVRRCWISHCKLKSDTWLPVGR